nr:unnamed protein product [Callosobruchus analis]
MNLFEREIREEIKNSVTSSVASLLKQDDFIKQIIQKVTEAVEKTLQEKFDQLQEKVKEFVCNSPVIGDLKSEIAALKAENDYILKKQDEFDQERRSNNLIIFKIEEKEKENLTNEVVGVCDRHLGIKLSDHDIRACYRIGQRTNNKPRGILVRFHDPEMKELIYKKKKMLKGLI